MGQSTSRHAPPIKKSQRSVPSTSIKQARHYAQSDDDIESVYRVPKLSRRTTLHQPEARNIESTSRRQRPLSHNTARPTNIQEKQTKQRTKDASQRKRSMIDRHVRYDESGLSHRHDGKTIRSAASKPKSQLSPSGSHRRKPRQRKDCVICTDNRSVSHFPSEPPTAHCTHNADVCRRCLRTWISTAFTSKGWDEIDCPVCSVRLDYEDIRMFAPSEVFRRYKKLSTKAALEAIPGFHWCLTKGCKSGQVIDPATNKFRCVNCKKTHCMEHNVAWHRKETCKEYEYRTNKSIRKGEEKASKNWIKEKTKHCPGCKRPIEKTYGCDHMTCSKCRHEFCWECLAPYKKRRDLNSVTHRAECPHHEEQVLRAGPVVWDQGWFHGP